MPEPFGRLVNHKFSKTTVVGTHVYFKGSTVVPEQILKKHKQEVAEAKRKAELAAAREGMSATEVEEFDAAEGISHLDNDGEGEGEGENAGLRTDGPTPEAWVRSGYSIENYPPEGYAAKPYENEAGFPALLEKIAAEKAK